MSHKTIYFKKAESFLNEPTMNLREMSLRLVKAMVGRLIEKRAYKDEYKLVKNADYYIKRYKPHNDVVRYEVEVINLDHDQDWLMRFEISYNIIGGYAIPRLTFHADDMFDDEYYKQVQKLFKSFCHVWLDLRQHIENFKVVYHGKYTSEAVVTEFDIDNENNKIKDNYFTKGGGAATMIHILGKDYFQTKRSSKRLYKPMNQRQSGSYRQLTYDFFKRTEQGRIKYTVYIEYHTRLGEILEIVLYRPDGKTIEQEVVDAFNKTYHRLASLYHLRIEKIGAKHGLVKFK